jgi:hypothetical protein
MSALPENRPRSVEPGAVLGDVANAASPPSALLGNLGSCWKRIVRSGNQGNIFALSNAGRNRAVHRAVEVLNSVEHPGLRAGKTPPPLRTRRNCAKRHRRRELIYTGLTQARKRVEVLFQAFSVASSFDPRPSPSRRGTPNLQRRNGHRFVPVQAAFKI